jgi:hypothetical protein
MTQPELAVAVTTTTEERLVLVRLCVKVKRPLSRARLIATIAEALAPPLDRDAALAAARAALERCEQARHVAGSPPALTAEGQRVLPRLLGTNKLPAFASWRAGKQVAAFGPVVSGGKGDAADVIAACVLAAEHGLPDPPRSAKQVVDRLCWRALGIDSHAAFTSAAVQRHLLREIVPADVRVEQRTWRRMLAMRALDARGHDAEALTRARLARGAARRVPAPPAQPPPRPVQPVDAPAASLAEFASAVRAAARSPEVARFHDDRAFIGSVWEHMRGQQPVGDMSLADFKRTLIRAHRQRLLRITRADLVAAMDATEIARSEARYQDATFHFVALDSGGSR